MNLDIWVQMNSSKSFPQNCGVGGNEKGETYTGPLYITRKQIGSEMVIGKISEGAKIAYCKFPFDHQNFK